MWDLMTFFSSVYFIDVWFVGSFKYARVLRKSFIATQAF